MSIDSPKEPVLQSLDVIRIKTPCQMDWDLMTGDDQSRHCDHCEKNVYNIAEMSEQQAIDLINEKEGKVCLRLFRRPDGTVVTADCLPVKKYYDSSGKRSWYQFSMASLMMLIVASAGVCALAPSIGKKLKPIYDSWFAKTTFPAPIPAPGPIMGIVGDIRLPPKPVPAPTLTENQPEVRRAKSD